ncbi:MAG: DUF4476 domain-containing protein [Bacteroidia bacterium]|nr:DUF4476 domain-containing protein [Bacteroidia bacterium]
MKTTFTLFTFLALSLFSDSARAAIGSKLHLNLFNDGNFVVVVDGIRYTNVRGDLDVFNLRAGTHHVKIVEVFGRQGRGNRGREVLYNGSINIPFRSAVFARLTNNLRLRVTEVRRLNPQRTRYDRRAYPQRRYDPPSRRRGYNRRYNGGYQNVFATTKMQMRAASFDRDKLAIAKQFARTSNPTSAEIAQLTRMLSFDRSKVQLAKFAYPFTVDQHNYGLVSDSFTFDSSVRELNRFIARSANNPPQRRRR